LRVIRAKIKLRRIQCSKKNIKKKKKFDSDKKKFEDKMASEPY